VFIESEDDKLSLVREIFGGPFEERKPVTQLTRSLSTDKILQRCRRIYEWYGPWTTNVNLGDHGVYTLDGEAESRGMKLRRFVQIVSMLLANL
jgi:hypothetical protein